MAKNQIDMGSVNTPSVPKAPGSDIKSGSAFTGETAKNRRKKMMDEMPEMAEVDSDESMTSAGRLDQMLQSDSKLMQRAKTQGEQTANSRGLLNSSMAAGAAQGAMIDRAQPFALQDSNNLMQNARQDAGAENEQRALQSSTLADSYMQNQSAGLQSQRDQQKFEQDLARTSQKYGLESAVLEQEGQQAMENLYGTSLANAWGVMGNNVTDIVAQSMIEISDIQNNPDIKPRDKTKMIDQIKSARDSDVEFQAELYSTLPDTLQDTNVFPDSVG